MPIGLIGLSIVSCAKGIRDGNVQVAPDLLISEVPQLCYSRRRSYTPHYLHSNVTATTNIQATLRNLRPSLPAPQKPPQMKAPLRIAVLECDEPVGKAKEKYGGYGNLFKELLNAGADHIAQKDGARRPELDVTKFDVVNTEHYPTLENVDAVLLTGSSMSSPPPAPSPFRRRWGEKPITQLMTDAQALGSG